LTAYHSGSPSASAQELASEIHLTLPVTPIVSRRHVSSNQFAPLKQKKVGTESILTRYIHKYECEDFMEYAVDTFMWKKSLECQYHVDSGWEVFQTEITPKMRSTLLRWMVAISRDLEYSLETWCLAVNYVDRFLSSQLLAKDCLQLVGLTALWLGAKQQELDPPTSEELVALCVATYTARNFNHMELLMLVELKFYLAAPTAAYHLSHLVAVEGEEDWAEDLSRHLVEMVMEDYVLARNLPSKIAHAIYKVIKGCDLNALHIVENCCPWCEPTNTDQWCRDFFKACLGSIANLLSRDF